MTIALMILNTSLLLLLKASKVMGATQLRVLSVRAVISWPETAKIRIFIIEWGIELNPRLMAFSQFPKFTSC